MKTGTKALIIGTLVASTGAIALAASGYATEARSGPEFRQLAEYRHGGHRDGERRYGKRGGLGHMWLLEAFDANQDGKVTQAEIDAVRRDRLAKFDADKDGQLTLSEYEALWLDAMRERMVDRFQDLDADGDAVVTVVEFGEPFARVVARWDRDGDGELAAADFRSRHRRGGDRDDD